MGISSGRRFHRRDRSAGPGTTPAPHILVYDDQTVDTKQLKKTRKKNKFVDTGVFKQVTEIFAGSRTGRWWESSVLSGMVRARGNDSVSSKLVP